MDGMIYIIKIMWEFDIFNCFAELDKQVSGTTQNKDKWQILENIF